MATVKWLLFIRSDPHSSQSTQGENILPPPPLSQNKKDLADSKMDLRDPMD